MCALTMNLQSLLQRCNSIVFNFRACPSLARDYEFYLIEGMVEVIIPN